MKKMNDSISDYLDVETVSRIDSCRRKVQYGRSEIFKTQLDFREAIRTPTLKMYDTVAPLKNDMLMTDRNSYSKPNLFKVNKHQTTANVTYDKDDEVDMD